MKTLILDYEANYCNYKAIVADFEKREISHIEPFRYAIEDMYVLNEPMEVKYKKGKDWVVKNGDKGDIVVLFYYDKEITTPFDPVVIIKNETFKKNVASINAKKAAEQAAKETYCSQALSI